MIVHIFDPVVFSAVLTAFGLICLIISVYTLVRKYQRNRLLDKYGVLSNAIVKRRRIVGKYRSRLINYEFEANGRRYEYANLPVYSGTYSRLKEGAEVQIRYLADDPTQSRLADYHDTADIDGGCISVVLFLLLTLVGLGINIYSQH